MKKLLFLMVLILGLSASELTTPVSAGNFTSQNSRIRGFSSTQKLSSSDGREIYLYPSGKCELYDGDRLEVSCSYALGNGEIKLMANGQVIYKGTVSLDQNGNVRNLTIAGTIYRRK